MKNVVEVTRNQLNAIYRAASTEVKDMMKNMFPNVVGHSVIDRIKTWYDVCEELNIDQEAWDQMVNAMNAACPMTTGEAKCAIAHMKVLMLAKVLNEGWELTKEAEDNQEGYGIYWLKRDGVRGDVDFQVRSLCAPGYVYAINSFGPRIGSSCLGFPLKHVFWLNMQSSSSQIFGESIIIITNR